VRAGLVRGLEVVGIRHGFFGLLANDFWPMGPRDVSNVVQRGGTILKTTRSAEFRTRSGVGKAAQILRRRGIDGLVVIGGDGTFRGGVALGEAWPGRIIGVPGTIDNDVSGTDRTIGFDTAVETALQAIDKIRDTADSHERFFLVEVMGRNSGYIALTVGIAAGAEEILIPERPFDVKEICNRLCAGRARGKTSSILVVAEGKETGGAFKLAEKLKRLSKRQYRVVILGHVQRGGSPVASDRVLATKLGACAVDMLVRGESGLMVGEVGGELRTTPLRETYRHQKTLVDYLLRIHPAVSA
jgi:6-phosphofructokinase 1